METIVIVVVIAITVLVILSGVSFTVTYTPRSKK